MRIGRHRVNASAESSPDELLAATFARLVDAHLTRAYRLASVVLGNATDAEDAVQDAAVAAWRAFATLRDPDRFDAWFDRIVVNRCRDTLRRREGVRFVRIDRAPDSEAVDPSPATEQDAMAAALDSLPAAQRIVVVLRYFSDLSIDEIAARTGERSGTVKSRLHYGLSALRAAYAAADRADEV